MLYYSQELRGTDASIKHRKKEAHIMAKISNRAIDARAGQGKRNQTGQILFNWISNDEGTYNGVQRSVTEAFLSEGQDIIAAGSMLKTWVESEAEQYKEDARRRDWSKANRIFRESRESIYGMLSELLDQILSSMTEADWQILAADLLEEPWQTQIHNTR